MRYCARQVYHGLLVGMFLLISFDVSSQVDDVTFTLNRIQNNYAGYRDKVHGNKFSRWVSELLAKNNSDTFLLLSKIVNYFDDQHLQLYEAAPIKRSGMDSALCKAKVDELKNYFRQKKWNKDDYEGYWLNDYNSCVMAIVKLRNIPNTYQGFLMEARKGEVLPGYLIATFRKKRGQLFETEYLAPGYGDRFNLLSEFRSDSIFTMSDMGKWRKIKEYKNSVLPGLTPFSYKIRGELLDTNTYLLTMPDFWWYNVPVIDSLIKADSQKIRGVKTLIIDIRNNAGGTVNCYAPLLPFVLSKTDPQKKQRLLFQK